MGRFASRAEIDAPLEFGPVHVVPYAVGRVDAWSDSPSPDGENARLYGELGVRATTHMWRIYRDVSNRLLDINQLKHIISPEVGLMLATAGGVKPDQLYPLEPGIEEHIEDLSGVTFGVRQRLQTKRGAAGKRRTVDWMRLDIMAGFFDADEDFHPTADGRWFASRPEHSMGRDFVNLDYVWHVSDSVDFQADMNWDIDDSRIGRAGIGLAVTRSPRFQYFVGLRTIDDLNSAILTFAAKYQINRKYAIQFVEQFDMDYDGGTNLVTSLTITRKFPRWYLGVTISYDRRYDDMTVMLQMWPEGIPEVRLDTGRMPLSDRSEKN